MTDSTGQTTADSTPSTDGQVDSEETNGGRTGGEELLTTTGVTYELRSVTIIDDVSLSLRGGSLHGLVGPNGSGKTTLLELLAGIRTPTEGSITDSVEHVGRRVGYLPQRPAFRPTFTVLETLEFYASLVEDDPADLLERVGLEDAADRRVDALSGGMTRLLGLAQAMAGSPPIVLLDEPGSGLDPGMRSATIDVARSLAEAGTAVLYSTHDLELAEQHCDQLSLIDAGSVAATGSPAALAEQYDAADLREVFTTALGGTGDTVAVVGEGNR